MYVCLFFETDEKRQILRKWSKVIFYWNKKWREDNPLLHRWEKKISLFFYEDYSISFTAFIVSFLLLNFIFRITGLIFDASVGDHWINIRIVFIPALLQYFNKFTNQIANYFKNYIFQSLQPRTDENHRGDLSVLPGCSQKSWYELLRTWYRIIIFWIIFFTHFSTLKCWIFTVKNSLRWWVEFQQIYSRLNFFSSHSTKPLCDNILKKYISHSLFFFSHDLPFSPFQHHSNVPLLKFLFLIHSGIDRQWSN